MTYDLESNAVAAQKPSSIPVMLIVICAVSLAAVGLVTVCGVTFHYRVYPDFFFHKQLFGLGLASFAALATIFLPLERLRRHAWIFAGIAVLLLAITLIPAIGLSGTGGRRWLPLGYIRFQPSEIGKLVLVFFLAHYLALNQPRSAFLIRGFGIPLGITALFAVLVAMQPDCGNAAFIYTVGIFLLFLGGVRLRHLVPAILAPIALLAVVLYHSPYRLQRLVSFLDVEGNKSGCTYQLHQSLSAFARGGWTGAGLEAGQTIRIPDGHSNFILAVIGERFGLLAVIAVVVLFLVILVCGCLHLRRAPNTFQRLLVAGALFLIVFQAAIHIGVVTALFPTISMPLPFISVGFSNHILMGVIVGIFINTQRAWTRIALGNEKKPAREITGPRASSF